MSILLLPNVKSELERIRKVGVILKVDERLDWCAEMPCIHKSDNNVRISVDLTQLNKMCDVKNFSLPIKEQSLDRLTEAKYCFSK
jgi:hypothetical protein